MSDKSDRPDWLDELYQADNNESPPAKLDASIRAAAREAHGVRPWYRRTRTLASVATLAMALGITTLWLGSNENPATLAVTPAPEPIQESLADNAVLVSDAEAAEVPTVAKDLPASPAAGRAQLLQKSAARTSTQRFEDTTDAAREIGSIAFSAEQRSNLSSESCTTLTLIDVGESKPYAVCYQQDQSNLVSHPDCSLPYSEATAVAATEAQTGGLIVVVDGQRTRLSCDPETDSWVATGIAEDK